MTPRERVLATLRRAQPDRMPWMLNMTAPMIETFRQKTGADDFDAYYDLPCKIIVPQPASEPADFSRYYEGRVFDGPVSIHAEWGYAKVSKSAGTHLHHFESPFDGKEFTVADALNYPLPEMDKADCYRDVQQENDAWHAQGYATEHIMGFSTFDLSWLIRGYEALLMDMAMAEEAVMILMDRVSDAVAARLKQMAALGTDIVGVGEDVGNQRALIMSPGAWRAQIKPRFKKIVDAAKSSNLETLFFYHSDGKIDEIIPDLIEIGVDILNPVQPECMDPVAIKQEYGDKLAFWGAVGTQTTMPYGTPAEVRECVRHLFETVGKGGGFLCAPSHVLEPEVPWENIEAFVAACMECVY